MAKREGYTTVSLGKELINRIDEHSEDNCDFNRTLTIRKILTAYYRLKDKKVDILKLEAEDIASKVKQ